MKRSDLIQRAQKAFNAYIRHRDRDLPCISCGEYGEMQCGHYRTVGAEPGLRFHAANAHAQCAVCNCHLSGNRTAYRRSLIARVGVGMVEWIETWKPPQKWTSEDLIEIEKYYKSLVDHDKG